MAEEANTAGVEVFQGSLAACSENGLVLDAKGIGYDRVEQGEAWILTVAPALGEIAQEELRRYAEERVARRQTPIKFVPHTGSGFGSAVYAVLLIGIAYCTGIELFDTSWLDAGALEVRGGATLQWWRPVTALTLHFTQEHLLGNLLFGIVLGTFAGRVFGPGIAWLAILSAGALGNTIELLVAPPWHRAAGASTAVFAALGLLAGFGWIQRSPMGRARYYRWAPLFGGVCLLAFLGSGTSNQQVDVLGHVLGFVAGVLLGGVAAQAGSRLTRVSAVQWIAGTAALSWVGAAWTTALFKAVAQTRRN